MEQNRATKAELLREIASLKAQLSQALKMEAAGKLAGKVAHDFNNLLTTIIGYSELILSRMSQDDPFRMEMKEILKMGESAAAMTQELLAFIRKQSAQSHDTGTDSGEIKTQSVIYRGGETILLVEEEPSVRQLAQPHLKRMGYTLLKADSITEAIRICSEYSDPIHLLLADIALPGMSGIELYANLREIRTEMKAIFISGHSLDSMAKHNVPDEGIGFIQKPFTGNDLMHCLRNVLDRS
jgi:CheY-like chemotaxis protein